MEAIENIKTRRATRRFNGKEVSDEVIKSIIEIAAFAPSWKNSQTVRYEVIKDKALKEKIAKEAVMGFDWNTDIIMNAPALVVLKTVNGISGYEKDGSESTSKGSHWQSFDAGLAAQTFSLAAHELGVSSVILGIYDEDVVKNILSIDNTMSISALIPIGYNDTILNAPKRKSVDELLIIK